MEENQIVIYQTDNGQTAIDVRLENETVWLSANQMSILFACDEKTIRKHINNVFAENELHKENNTHFLRVISGCLKKCAYHFDNWMKSNVQKMQIAIQKKHVYK